MSQENVEAVRRAYEARRARRGGQEHDREAQREHAAGNAATAAMCDALTVDELLGGRELALDRGYVPPDVDLLGPGPLLDQA